MDMATNFLAKYFPPAKSVQIKIEISTFRQNEFEQLYEAWKHYKELLRRCPNHGFKDWVQIEFYNGLNRQTKTTVDAAAGGMIFAKSPNQALLEEMIINSYQWPSDRARVKQSAGVYAVYPITSLANQVSAIATQHAALNQGNQFFFSNVAAGSIEEKPNGYGGYRGFNAQKGESKPYFEDLVGTFVAESNKRMRMTKSRLYSMELNMTNMGATMKSLETQIGQLTTNVNSHTSGTSSTNNAGKNLKEVNEISVQHVENEVVVEQEELSFSIGRRGKKGEEVLVSDIDISKFFYPQRYLQLIADSQLKKVLENAKEPSTNIHIADTENVKVPDDCLEVMQRTLTPKLEDPGKFTVPFFIGGQFVGEALCDLGASVNVLSSSLYKKLGLGELKSTQLMLQMADKSVGAPCGLLEDVFMNVDRLLLPADFLVLDFEGDPKVPIILGRPFLDTADAKIDVKEGEITMEVNGRKVKFRLRKEGDSPEVGKIKSKTRMEFVPP